MAVSTYLSVIILNVNRSNASIKRQREAEWIQKQNHETQFKSKVTHRKRGGGKRYSM